MIYYLHIRQAGVVKIGFTASHPLTRTRQIDRFMPWPVECLGWHDGGKKDEKRIHVVFHALRLRGEWFSDHPDLLQHIKTNCHNLVDAA